MVKIRKIKTDQGEGMSQELETRRPIDNLLKRVNPRWRVVCELERLDTTPTGDLTKAEREQASLRFNQLVWAERFKLKMSRTDQQLDALRGNDHKQAQYKALLNEQLETAITLYGTLRGVNRTLVPHPDGGYVRIVLIKQMDDLYKRMNEIRHELNAPERPQDT